MEQGRVQRADNAIPPVTGSRSSRRRFLWPRERHRVAPLRRGAHPGRCRRIVRQLFLGTRGQRRRRRPGERSFGARLRPRERGAVSWSCRVGGVPRLRPSLSMTDGNKNGRGNRTMWDKLEHLLRTCRTERFPCSFGCWFQMWRCAIST